jgi:hypothetical protein
MNVMSLSPLYYTKNKSDISYEGIIVNLYHQKNLSLFFYHSTVGQYITCWKNASNSTDVSHYQHGNNFA